MGVHWHCCIRIGAPHTVPMKLAGKCGSVSIRLVPAPRGSGVVGSPTMKKMLQFAWVADCFSCSCGHTRTKGNFMKATFEALRATYGYLTPDLWKPTHYVKPPFQEFTDYLAQSRPRPCCERGSLGEPSPRWGGAGASHAR